MFKTSRLPKILPRQRCFPTPLRTPHSPSNTLHTTSPTKSSASTPQKDAWSPSQYLLFASERTRPVHDLTTFIRPLLTDPNPRIYDLGCGPGNSTAVLADEWPGARITGVDSSAEMLQQAAEHFHHANPNQDPKSPKIDFINHDISTFKPQQANSQQHQHQQTLLFSNAAFHWLRSPTRLQTLTSLLASLTPNSLLALQLPDNYHAPTHTTMRHIASLPHQPWSPFFPANTIANTADPSRPDLDPVELPAQFYAALLPYASVVTVWRTEYMHVLESPSAVVEWVRGTGLAPFLARIPAGAGAGAGTGEGTTARRAFLAAYEKAVGEVVPRLVDGKVLLGYPRLFVVAVRK